MIFNISFIDNENKVFDFIGDNIKVFTDNNISVQSTKELGKNYVSIDISSHNS